MSTSEETAATKTPPMRCCRCTPLMAITRQGALHRIAEKWGCLCLPRPCVWPTSERSHQWDTPLTPPLWRRVLSKAQRVLLLAPVPGTSKWDIWGGKGPRRHSSEDHTDRRVFYTQNCSHRATGPYSRTAPHSSLTSSDIIHHHTSHIIIHYHTPSCIIQHHASYSTHMSSCTHHTSSHITYHNHHKPCTITHPTPSYIIIHHTLSYIITIIHYTPYVIIHYTSYIIRRHASYIIHYTSSYVIYHTSSYITHHTSS